MNEIDSVNKMEISYDHLYFNLIIKCSFCICQQHDIGTSTEYGF